MTQILTAYPSSKIHHPPLDDTGDITRVCAWSPSSPEQTVTAALSTIPGIFWEREYEVRYGEQIWTVDFVVQTGHRRIAIAVQGDWVKQQKSRTRPNKIKIRAGQLRCCFDELIFLEESDIASPDFASRLSGLLGQAAAVCR